MRRRGALGALAVVAVAAIVPAVAAAHPGQHGTEQGHLLGSGEFGALELVGKLDLTDTNDLVADVAVDPRGDWAYLANWGEPDCAANSEAGGINSPDAGAWVVDISDPANPTQVGFIPHSQDSRPGEGMQAVRITTPRYSGHMLVMNNEQCGKNGKGGVSLIDVSDPATPKKLSEHFGDRGFADTNDVHSAFAWDAGDRAYVVMTDNFESTDVDILDITNPKRPRKIADVNLNSAFGPIDQPELGLQESSLHDMIVKEIDGRFVMLLSYWDGGYVLLDVTDPASPTFIDDTDFGNPDPELFESTGIELPPEGNAHQAEFTSDNRFFIGTDEDFSPYRVLFNITTGPHFGEYPGGEFGWTVPVVTLPDKELNGPTVFGGYGCPDDRGSIPAATEALPSVEPGEERILVLERGPVQDPSHSSHGACFFSEKVESAQLAGYDGVIIPNHHVGAQAGDAPDAHFCGGQGHEFDIQISATCVGHRAMHLLFGSEPTYDVPYVAGTEPAVGTVGERVSMPARFDGWGYVHLYDAETRQELDTYAIDEAHDESFAFGSGDLSVHEVATDPQDPSRAYLAYYSGGMRAVDIDCSGGGCELDEVGGYLDPAGNDFWGVEAFVGDDDRTYVLGSDRDSGLWIFRRR